MSKKESSKESSKEGEMFKFIGNGDSDPSELHIYGKYFSLGGDSILIKDKAHIKKLLGNSHFEKK